jgi:hypothetical protein
MVTAVEEIYLASNTLATTSHESGEQKLVLFLPQFRNFQNEWKKVAKRGSKGDPAEAAFVEAWASASCPKSGPSLFSRRKTSTARRAQECILKFPEIVEQC